MEEKKMHELNLDEMDKVSGGIQITLRDGSPVVCAYCRGTDWTNHGWSEAYPRGYRLTCNNCPNKAIFDGDFWFTWR